MVISFFIGDTGAFNLGANTIVFYIMLKIFHLFPVWIGFTHNTEGASGPTFGLWCHIGDCINQFNSIGNNRNVVCETQTNIKGVGDIGVVVAEW